MSKDLDLLIGQSAFDTIFVVSQVILIPFLVPSVILSGFSGISGIEEFATKLCDR